MTAREDCNDKYLELLQMIIEDEDVKDLCECLSNWASTDEEIWEVIDEGYARYVAAKEEKGVPRPPTILYMYTMVGLMNAQKRLLFDVHHDYPYWEDDYMRFIAYVLSWTYPGSRSKPSVFMTRDAGIDIEFIGDGIAVGDYIYTYEQFENMCDVKRLGIGVTSRYI